MYPRYPWLRNIGTGLQCQGGFRYTYQQWLDLAVSYEGICVDGFEYTKKGIFIKSNKFINGKM